MFKALMLDKQDDRTVASIQSIDESRLALSGDGGDVLVRIDFSTLNYKDGLAITGRAPVVRMWPMVPGIDFAGVVEASSHPDYEPGDKVVMNGWGAGETHWGGLAQKARVPGDHLIALPANITTRQAMAVGTAGYTAMLCVQALEKHGIGPKDGDVLVTGANGGVGSFAVAILAKRGFRVIASTGRPEEAARLRELGAADIVERATLSEPGKPLQKERWAAAVDCVGSHTLANVCASLRYGAQRSGWTSNCSTTCSRTPSRARGRRAKGCLSASTRVRAVRPASATRAGWPTGFARHGRRCMSIRRARPACPRKTRTGSPR